MANNAGMRSGQGEEPSRIPVAYLILGYQNNRNTIINFCRNAKSMINLVTDAIQPTLGSEIDWFWNEISDARRKRGVKCTQLTDITTENLRYCKKEIMTRIDELRHLDGIKECFGVTDSEAVAMVPPYQERELDERRSSSHDIQFIYSDTDSVVRLKQLLFDLLWTRATPAQLRIDELEGKGKKQDSTLMAAGRRRIIETTIEAKKKNIIDRIYVCNDCHAMFISTQEVEQHKRQEGHRNFREYPLV